jgi:hypothetical protein
MAKESKAAAVGTTDVGGAAPSGAIVIKPLNNLVATFRICGTSPYVMNKFSEESHQAIREKHVAGGTAKGKKQRNPKDFNALFEKAKYISKEGWVGINASSFRSAMISACKLVGYPMTKAKMSIFTIADGMDDRGTSLVRIWGECVPHEGPARNQTGVIDIRCRPIWYDWAADVTIRWDGDQFTANDVANLLHRAGQQVGVGEGRPDSRNSSGCGWGTFEVVDVNPSGTPEDILVPKAVAAE